jgi:uncharacterized protein YqfA (UPF0365 family)
MLALGVTGLTFVILLGLYLLYTFIGEMVWMLAIAALAAGAGIWLADWVTEKWAERQKERTKEG